MAQDAIDGWIYRQVSGTIHAAYVVRDIRYFPEERRSNDYTPAYVEMKLRANRAEWAAEDQDNRDDGLQTISETFSRDDIVGASASDVLLKKGILKETVELKAAYEAEIGTFLEYKEMGYRQFLVTGTALDTGGRWNSVRDSYKLLHPTKMVNEEPILSRKITVQCDHYNWEQYLPKKSKAFGTIPIHPYFAMFDLDRHQHCWVHVADCKPYEYDESLRDKLVLPDIHRDLIDVLTTDMDVFMDDLIAGKSGGTAVLCYGSPGLGKTLTAEVYSELIKRPLYKVHAGQLGTDVSTVENELERVLRRGERWGAVMLLDEADVYIRRRGDDLQHNAVVAAFLRTLEYFHGLLFMTTNRAADVDDAIASRMIAMVKYEAPDEAQAKKLWEVLSTQFRIQISAKAIDALIKEFEGISGRDIKQLLKLTQKYCRQKGLKMSLDAFRTCATFRGIR